MVFAESARLVGIGSVIGLALAVWAMRPLAMFLVAGLSPADPASLAAVVVVLTRDRPAGHLGTRSPRHRWSIPIAALRHD